VGALESKSVRAISPFNARASFLSESTICLMVQQSHRPPQLAASSISNHRCDVAYWHLADVA
jgi:hypothetical protein